MSSLDGFNAHRPLLFAIAYRMLGTATDAEDMVQETFLRWQQTNYATVKSPKSYLTTTLTRLCIDHLRSARVRREQYVGSWLPEPLLTQATDDPAEHAELADSLSIAFLVLLERLAPIERAVFLLREVFEYDYAEIAEIVGKSSANCRQIFARSRQHLTQERSRFSVSSQQQEQMTQAFLEASSKGDLKGLLALLAKEVTLYSDGGGKVVAAQRPLQGAMKVARFLVAIRRKAISMPAELKSVHITRAEMININGQAGILQWSGDEVHSAIVLEICDRTIQTIYTIRNPDKLKRLGEAARLVRSPAL